MFLSATSARAAGGRMPSEQCASAQATIDDGEPMSRPPPKKCDSCRPSRHADACPDAKAFEQRPASFGPRAAVT